MEVKLLAKKLVYLYTSFALIVSFLGISVFAEENLQCNQAPFAYWKTTLHVY